MNTLTIIIIAIAGIVLGAYLGRRKRCGAGASPEKADKMNEVVRERKEESKDKVLEFLQNRNERVTNDDVEKMLKVSDATATNYLQELVDEGKLRQIGETGKGVYYTLPNA